MSRAESQPISSREHRPKAGKIAGYMLSAAIAAFGINQVVHSTEGNAEFYQQHPQVNWAKDIESDFRVEINRVLLENDSQGLEELKVRILTLSSALTILDELEDEIPHPDPFGGISLVAFGALLGMASKVLIDGYHEEKEMIRNKVPKTQG